MRVTHGLCPLSVSLAVALTLTAPSSAETPEPLRVERAPGAEECPDAAGLAERVAAIRGHTDLPTSGGYSVGFTRSDELYRATIRSGPGGESERVLEGRGPSCAALTQATAVTLALLFDSQPAPPLPEPEPKPAPTAPPPPAVATLDTVEPVAPDLSSKAPRVKATASLGAGAAFGVIGSAAPALSGELGLGVGGFRAGLGVLWIPKQSLELDPGRVDETLVAGTARSCLALTGSERLTLSVCSGIAIGVVDARSAGYTQNARRVRSWLSVPLEISLAELSGPVGWELSASALGSLVHHDFEIDGLGAPYRAPRVGALLLLRGVGVLPL